MERETSAPRVERSAMERAFGQMPLERIYVGPGAARALPALLDELGATGDAVVLHVPDPEPGLDALVGEVTEATRSRLPARGVTARSGRHGVILDEATVAQAILDAGAPDLVVAVGSGTISDLAKAVAHHHQASLVSVQSAASVNGYSNGLSVLMRNGIKRTTPTAWPTALLIDPDVLEAAPDRLAQAGVGDAVAIWTAPADWYVAHALGTDPRYHERFFTPVRDHVEQLHAQRAERHRGMQALIGALTVGGLAIGAAGSTAPLSGCEHLMSHLIDMVAAHRDQPHDLHGAQVGAATVTCTALWTIVMDDLDRPSALLPDAIPSMAQLEERTREAWSGIDPSGGLGRHCWSIVEAKWRALLDDVDAINAVLAKWDDHRARLRQLLPDPARPGETLRAWGAPTALSQLDPALDEDEARWVLRTLPFVRDRVSIADLLVIMGRWDDGLHERVRQEARRMA